jgi:acetyltransferase-like isoleucine patch superfamily enzyme
MGDIISTRDKVTFGEIVNHYHSNILFFGIKYSKQWILERLAYSVPVNSWRVKMHRMRGVNIGKNVYIGYKVLFDRLHPELITIGDSARIGDWCIFSAHTRGSLTTRQAYPRIEKPIKIGCGVCINSRCIVTQGVEIGENSIIYIGSVVTRNIPPNSLAKGYPAKVVKDFEDAEKLST